MPLISEGPRYLFARWLLPISSPPVENACLILDGKRIAGVITRAEYAALADANKEKATVDYGEAVIMPGLINLHTHLDYSALKHFDTHSPFFPWIRGLIANSWQWTDSQWRQSAVLGAREIALSGTTCIADSSYKGVAAYGASRIGLRAIVGLELFGIIEEKSDLYWADWLRKYAELHESADELLRSALTEKLIVMTVAPHTPYSVCPALLKKALGWSREKQLPLFLHIGESEMECRWIAGSEPDVDKFLYESTKEEVAGGIGNLAWKGHGLTPVQHLHQYGLLADNILAAHVVKVDKNDIDLLVERKLSVAHCPRSNSRLRNGIAPFSQLVEAGLNLGFGTDSAASGDDLNVLAEARFAWDLHRAVDPNFDQSSEKALYYLTLGAAQALGLNNSIGSLEAGKLADVAVFGLDSLPELARRNPVDCLIYGGAILKDVFVDGAQIVRGGSLCAQTLTSAGK